MSHTEFKYVAGEIKTSYGVVFGAIVLPKFAEHSCVKHCFKSIDSAGFAHFDQHDVHIHGRSESLGIGSKPERDARFVGQAIAHPKYRL